MNGNNLLIDTNIALYLFYGDTRIKNILQDIHLYLSFVSELELLSYSPISLKTEKIINSFINDCIIIDINREIKNNTIIFRRKYNLKLPDSIIAGTCKYLNVPFLTADKEFSKLTELQVLIYEI